MGGFLLDKPLPMPSEDSKPFWEACQRQAFLLQQCAGCGHFRFPPSLTCPRCMSDDCAWVQASGRARVYTFEITHRPFYPAWEPPYNVAIVELEEGPRVHTNIVGCGNDEIHIGMPVELVFEKIEGQDWYLPRFRPARAE